MTCTALLVWEQLLGIERLQKQIAVDSCEYTVQATTARACFCGVDLPLVELEALPVQASQTYSSSFLAAFCVMPRHFVWNLHRRGGEITTGQLIVALEESLLNSMDRY